MEGQPPSTASNSGVTTKGAELPPLWMGLWERGRASLLGVLKGLEPSPFLPPLDPLAGCMNLLWAPQAARAGEPYRVDPSPMECGSGGPGKWVRSVGSPGQEWPLGLCWSP